MYANKKLYAHQNQLLKTHRTIPMIIEIELIYNFEKFLCVLISAAGIRARHEQLNTKVEIQMTIVSTL